MLMDHRTSIICQILDHLNMLYSEDLVKMLLLTLSLSSLSTKFIYLLRVKLQMRAKVCYFASPINLLTFCPFWFEPVSLVKECPPHLPHQRCRLLFMNVTTPPLLQTKQNSSQVITIVSERRFWAVFPPFWAFFAFLRFPTSFKMQIMFFFLSLFWKNLILLFESPSCYELHFMNGLLRLQTRVKWLLGRWVEGTPNCWPHSDG